MTYESPLPPPGTSVPALYPTPIHCVGPSSYGRCLDILAGLLETYTRDAHARIYKLYLGWYLAVYDLDEWEKFKK